MLNQIYFYHGCLRKTITLFGTLFSDIAIKRSTGDGYEYQEIKVPLSYAPKQRTLVRIKQNPNIDNRQAQVTVPRMSFEMTSLNYDSSRKINKTSVSRKMTSNQTSTTYAQQLYSPTPYNVNINLYIYVKNQEDGLQIVEQIFPFFNPELCVTIKTIPEMNVRDDIPVILNSVSYEDDYEGEIETRRTIIWTLSFTLKMNFYGPITTNGVIKKVNVNVQQTNDSSIENATTMLQYKAVVNPFTASINDDYTVDETFGYIDG